MTLCAKKQKVLCFILTKKWQRPKKESYLCVCMCVVSLLSFEINFTKFKKGKEFSQNEKIESIWVVMKKKKHKVSQFKTNLHKKNV